MSKVSSEYFRGEQIGTCELHIVKTVPIITDAESVRTIGAFVDEMLSCARADGDRISRIAVNLDEKFW